MAPIRPAARQVRTMARGMLRSGWWASSASVEMPSKPIYARVSIPACKVIVQGFAAIKILISPAGISGFVAPSPPIPADCKTICSSPPHKGYEDALWKSKNTPFFPSVLKRNPSTFACHPVDGSLNAPAISTAYAEASGASTETSITTGSFDFVRAFLRSSIRIPRLALDRVRGAYFASTASILLFTAATSAFASPAIVRAPRADLPASVATPKTAVALPIAAFASSFASPETSRAVWAARTAACAESFAVPASWIVSPKTCSSYPRMAVSASELRNSKTPSPMIPPMTNMSPKAVAGTVHPTFFPSRFSFHHFFNSRTSPGASKITPIPVTMLQATSQKNIRSLCVDSACRTMSTGGEDVARIHEEARYGLIIMACLGLILVCEVVYICLRVKV
jgi:hypothetical protein